MVGWLSKHCLASSAYAISVAHYQIMDFHMETLKVGSREWLRVILCGNQNYIYMNILTLSYINLVAKSVIRNIF